MNELYAQKEIINLRLTNLGNVPSIPQPTKMELYGKRRMLDRVQRLENRRYKKEIVKQQKDFTERKRKIEEHIRYIQNEKARREIIISNLKDGEMSPTFSPFSTFTLKPIEKFPIQIKTRLSRAPRMKGPFSNRRY